MTLANPELSLPLNPRICDNTHVPDKPEMNLRYISATCDFVRYACEL